jgi:hypothetical protein
MKIYLTILALVLTAAAVNTISEEQLSEELAANRQLWLVYRSNPEN